MPYQESLCLSPCGCVAIGHAGIKKLCIAGIIPTLIKAELITETAVFS